MKFRIRWFVRKIKRKKGTNAQFKLHKERALLLATERLLYFNQFYNFPVGKVTIRNQKTRWGSCSKKGNINFNYKIALLPPYLADYLVVHELCHIGQFNHSRDFWELVEKTVPEYKKYRAEMKRVKIC